MSATGKVIVVGVVAIAVVAAWRAGRHREAPPVPARGTEPQLRTAPEHLRAERERGGSDVGQAAPSGNRGAQPVRRLNERGRSRGDEPGSASSGPAEQLAASAARLRRHGMRRAAPTGDQVSSQAGEEEQDAADAAELDSLKQKALTDPDPEERIDALASLYPFDDAAVLPVLQTALADHDSEVRLAALEKLSDLDEPPVDVVAVALKDSDAEVREEAIVVLSGIDDARVQTLIRDAAHSDPDEDVRNTAELYSEDPDLGESDSDEQQP